jgi:hypothetical protein
MKIDAIRFVWEGSDECELCHLCFSHRTAPTLCRVCCELWQIDRNVENTDGSPLSIRLLHCFQITLLHSF